MNTDTPETEKLTDADFKNIDEDMETATLQAYNRLHDLCADMERERNQARQERDELKDALEHASAFVVAFTMAAPILADLPMSYNIADTGYQGEITPNQIIAMSEKALEKLK